MTNNNAGEGMKLIHNSGRYCLKFYLSLISVFFVALPADANELKFITIDVAPWASANEETQIMEGAFIEMVKEIEIRTNHSISITLTPFARVYRELDSGDHDCTILIPLDETAVAKGELVAYHDMGVIPHRDIVLSHYEQLYDLNISLLRGSAIMERFDNDDALHKEYDTDYLISLRKIARKRADAIAGAIPTILFLAEQNDLDE